LGQTDAASDRQTSKQADAAKEADGDLKAQVRSLIRDLDAAELATREGAEQKLLDLGPAALDLLPQPTNKMSAEVRERLGRVREKLQRAEAEAVTKAAVVTLDVEKQPLSKVLEAIEKQSGNQFNDYRETFGQQSRDPKVTLQVEGAPFWQAVDQALDEADSTIYAYADDQPDALAIVDRPEGELPRLERAVAYSGPFRLEATSMEVFADLRNPLSRSLTLLLDLAWEPRLKPVTVEMAMSDIEAVDEGGNPIDVDGEEGRQEITIVAGEHVTELRVPLVMPQRSVARIASLKGKFTALVPGRMEEFRFTDFKKANQSQPRNGAVVTLERVRRNNEIWEFRVRVRFDDAAGALQSHLDWISNNEAELETSDGTRIEADGIETYRRTDDEVGVGYLFGIDGGLAGLTLVYKTPTVIVPLEVDFELKDMELP
jgi:hypothetical protein